MQKLCNRTVAMLLTMLLVLILPLAVRAEGYAVQVQIPVTVDLEGDTPPEDPVFTVKIAAKTASDPLPDATALEIKVHDGQGTGSFAPITYTVPGDYHYTVSQQPCTQSGMTCDTAVFDVTVRVVNQDGGLCAEAFARRSGSDRKTGVVCFVNRYQAARPTATPTATPTTAPTAPPASPPPPQPARRAPQTGDDFAPAFWVVVAALSSLALLILARHKRSRQ